MISEMLQTNFEGQTVLDMGSGTGVLAILAEKLGATDIDAIDIDEWAFENAEENKTRNGASRITCYQSGAELLGKKIYDTILANINRNILLRDMHAYAAVLKSGGTILFSGFYSQDIPYLLEEGAKHGLTEVGRRELNEWNLLAMKK